MSAGPTAARRRIRRLVGVYDADGTLRGELAYWVGARLGRAHCALCDISHGTVRVRPEWQQLCATMPVAFDTYHRDDQPENVRAAAAGEAPVVVAETDQGVVVLLRADDLVACHGSPDRLATAITEATEQQQLDWP